MNITESIAKQRGSTTADHRKQYRALVHKDAAGKPLTDDEIAALEAEVTDDPGEHVLFNLMLDTGLRSSEVAGLKLEDVDVKAGTLSVIAGKGGKSRTVPFGIAVQKLVLSYVFNHRSETDLPNLFITPRGLAYDNVSLRTLMRRLGRRTGIRRLHSHLLRHTYATRFLEAGGNALYLKMNLGHSTLAMTDRYVHLVGQRAAAASRQFSPFDHYLENRRRNSSS